MRNVTVAAVQMKCSKSVEKNIAHAEELVRQAAAKLSLIHISEPTRH